MRISVTYEGLTSEFDVAIDGGVTDHDVRHIGAELLLSRRPLPADDMDALGDGDVPTPVRAIDLSDHVVDRDTASNAIYLRPKVPFG